MSLQPEVPINDGWKDIVHHHVDHHNGWPAVSLPFPPPPPLNQHAQQISHIASHVKSSHASKGLKIAILEPKSIKDKKMVTHFKSSDDPSQSITSHTHQANEHCE